MLASQALSQVCYANVAVASLPLQQLAKDRPLSSSEGSTVDIRAPGEREGSVDMEPEESMEAEGCFTDGERYSRLRLSMWVLFFCEWLQA